MTTTATARRVTLTVHGLPQPKGSTKAFVPRRWAVNAYAAGVSPRAVVTSDNPKVKGWQLAITAAAVQSRAQTAPFDGPVSVTCTFALPRPSSYPKRIVHHVTKPDVDKLARAVLDALAGVLFGDDAAVTELHASKGYAFAGCNPGVVITVAETTPLDAVGDTRREAEPA